MTNKEIMLICFLISALILLATMGCSSQQHRREQLEAEHPDCFVFHDLTIECPDPFDKTAGFGMEVHNEKPKKTTTKKKKNGTNTPDTD